MLENYVKTRNLRKLLCEYGPCSHSNLETGPYRSCLRNFLTSVVWLYVGQIFVSVDHLKPLLVDFKCYYHKFALNICHQSLLRNLSEMSIIQIQ